MYSFGSGLRCVGRMFGWCCHFKDAWEDFIFTEGESHACCYYSGNGMGSDSILMLRKQALPHGMIHSKTSRNSLRAAACANNFINSKSQCDNTHLNEVQAVHYICNFKHFILWKKILDKHELREKSRIAFVPCPPSISTTDIFKCPPYLPSAGNVLLFRIPPSLVFLLTEKEMPLREQWTLQRQYKGK